MKKRIMILALIMLMIFAGCGKTTVSSSNNSTSTTNATTISSSASISSEDTSSVSTEASVSIENPEVDENPVSSDEPEVIEYPEIVEEPEIPTVLHDQEVVYYDITTKTGYMVEPIYKDRVCFDYDTVFIVSKPEFGEYLTKDTLSAEDIMYLYSCASNLEVQCRRNSCGNDYEDKIILDDNTLIRWTDFDSKAEFLDYLYTLFNKEIIDENFLIDFIFYDGPEGGLYVNEVARGSSIALGGQFYELEYVSDSKIIMHVIVEKYYCDEEYEYYCDLVEDFINYDFILEKIDESWKFTKYSFIY